MLILLSALLSTLGSMFRSRAALELENMALRHQIGVLKRSARKRPKLTPGRPSILGVPLPGLVRLALCTGHRQARYVDCLGIARDFASSGRGRSGMAGWSARRIRRGPRSPPPHLRMSRENALWGAPHIHAPLRTTRCLKDSPQLSIRSLGESVMPRSVTLARTIPATVQIVRRKVTLSTGCLSRMGRGTPVLQLAGNPCARAFQ